MGITAVASRGQFTTKTVSTTFAVSPNAAISAGALLAVMVTWESPGPQFASLKLVDNVGNLYALVAGSVGNAGTAAVWIYLCQLQHALATTDTLTFTLVGSGRAAKAVELFEFALDAGMVWAACSIRRGAQGANAAAAIANTQTTNLDTLDYLLLYAVGTQGPSTDTWTWQAGYTENHLGTTGGVDTTNRTLSWGYKLANLNTDTVAVTDTTANRAYRTGLIAICQVPDPGAFPTTPVVDDFNRADVNPLNGVAWDTACIGGHSTTGILQILSNRVASQTPATDQDGQWYLGFTNATNEAESYISAPVLVGGASGDSIYVYLHCTGCRGTANIGGYMAAWAAALSGQIPGDYIEAADRATNGDFALNPVFCFASTVNGGKLGIRKAGQVTHTLADSGSGFVRVISQYWDLQAGGQNFTSGKIGIGIHGSIYRLDDFGAGAVPVVANHLLPILGVGS